MRICHRFDYSRVHNYKLYIKSILLLTQSEPNSLVNELLVCVE